MDHKSCSATSNHKWNRTLSNKVVCYVLCTTSLRLDAVIVKDESQCGGLEVLEGTIYVLLLRKLRKEGEEFIITA